MEAHHCIEQNWEWLFCVPSHKNLRRRHSVAELMSLHRSVPGRSKGLPHCRHSRTTDNSLVVQQLLGAHSAKDFSMPRAQPVQGSTSSWGEGAWAGQLTKLAKGIFHTTDNDAKSISRGMLAGRGWLLLGNRLSINQCMVSNCVVHHTLFRGFMPFYFSFPLQLEFNIK